MKKYYVLCVLSMFCFLVGCGSQGDKIPEERVYVAEDELEKVYISPDDYKGKYIKVSGRVHQDSKVQEDEIYFEMYADSHGYNKMTEIYYSGVDSFALDDVVTVDGKIIGSHVYTDIYGNEIVAPMIESDNVIKGNYIDCFSPTIKESIVEETIDQYGYAFTINKIEYAEDETRLYVTISNAGDAELNVSQNRIIIVQNQKQYEYQSNQFAKYESIDTRLYPDTVTSGIVTFPPMDPESSVKIYCEAYCVDIENVKLETYVFEH